MIDFLRDLLARPGSSRTVILLDKDTTSTPRQYEVRPGYALYAAVIAIVVLAALLVAVVVLTPLRGLVMGRGAEGLRGVAQANAERAAALEDSLTTQYQQIAQLRAIITGEMDDMGDEVLDPSAFTLPDTPVATSPVVPRGEVASADHTQPALPLRTIGPAAEGGPARDTRAAVGLPRWLPAAGVATR